MTFYQLVLSLSIYDWISFIPFKNAKLYNYIDNPKIIFKIYLKNSFKIYHSIKIEAF